MLWKTKSGLVESAALNAAPAFVNLALTALLQVRKMFGSTSKLLAGLNQKPLRKQSPNRWVQNFISSVLACQAGGKGFGFPKVSQLQNKTWPVKPEKRVGCFGPKPRFHLQHVHQ